VGRDRGRGGRIALRQPGQTPLRFTEGSVALLNGLVFYVLLFATPQWKRLVPTSWGVFPNAASVAIQYLSLDWPADNGWVA